MNKKQLKKQLWFANTGFQGSILDRDILGVNTSASGQQVALCIGDSNMQGSSVQTSVVVPSNIMYYWNGSSWVMTTNGVNVITPGDATMFEEFIIAYNARTGYKVGFVQRGQSSTAFGPTFPGNDFNLAWAGQPRYTQAVNLANAACAAWGLTKPRFIFVNLGINDQTLNTQQYFDQVFDDLTRDFPGVPIIVVQPGTKGTVSQGAYNLRKIMIDQITKRDNAWFCGFGPAISTIGDNLHYNRLGLGNIGKMFNRLLSNKDYTNKWVRSVISQHFDDITTARKNVLKYVFTRQIENGNYFKLEALTIFQTGDLENVKNCFAFLSGYLVSDEPELIVNDSIRVGSDADLSCRFRTTTFNSRASQNDVMAGVRLTTITSLPAAFNSLFGATDATARFLIGKSSGAMNYSVNDSTDTSVAVSIQQNSWYSIFRNGTTRGLMRDETVLDSRVVASTGTPASLNGTHVGGHTNASGSDQGRIEANYKLFFACKYVGFDFASFRADMEYLIANW